ncbi:class I SAM-dependent methyltransferase [Winogradskyella costae]|uniref:SAM-dependent methyltransferase n=1 Tax=Winogradskyella costae TaxID=2697008 RepID=UPI0015C8BBAF|nr:SAM-dependent methyltransferase [Winogradskyella costae]
MNKIDQEYWEERYATHKTGWNVGYTSPPLKTYFDQLKDKTVKILIPGAGNSYEAEYLWNNGFKNLYILDFAQQPLNNFKKRIPEFPEAQLLKTDFFEWYDSYEYIFEQTFFCALDPSLREPYVEKMYQLLKNRGKLVGLFFNFELTENGPPFGGSLSEYKSLFEHKFHLKVLEPSINSIKERQGNELFFIFEKKS